MSMQKKVNRNPFNEKLLHRYLLEVFYGIHGGDRRIINNLLPDYLHHAAINLVVPEAHLPTEGYRPDLTLFFRDQNEGVPVEVKWSAMHVPNNQLIYLRRKNGVLISLDLAKSPYERVHCSQIDWSHFREWFSRSSLRLLRDAFNPDKEEGAGWVIVLRGQHAKENFDRMLDDAGISKAFWAFKNNPTSIKAVLELSKGDQLLFLFASTHGAEGSKMIREAGNLEVLITDWYICEVTDPYYMALSGERGIFFEASDLPINDRRWPHFVDFSIRSRKRGKTPTPLLRREFALPFADSANHGGIPVRLEPNQWEQLISLLNSADAS